MHNHVFYKMFTGSCILSLLATAATAALAEGGSNWTAAPRYAPDDLFSSEAANPWHAPDKQDNALELWYSPKDRNQQYREQGWQYPVQQAPSYQPPAYELPAYQVPYKQVPYDQAWGQQQDDSNQRERYVTPEIIESLNRQTAQHYSNQNGGENKQLMPYSQPNMYGQQAQEYPAYGMGGINPIYDVPAVSPWGSAPDVLYRGEEFSWLPNEAFGGMPPIHTPMFGGSSGLGRMNDSADKAENRVFNPFTFLQNEN